MPPRPKVTAGRRSSYPKRIDNSISKGHQKTITRKSNPTRGDADELLWSFAWFDNDFSLVKGEEKDVIQHFLSGLKALQHLGVKTLRNPVLEHFKSYDVGKIHREAQRRLVDLNRDDLDRIDRFRLSGRKRLFGSLRGSVFYVLWWDPQHQVYETKKKHT